MKVNESRKQRKDGKRRPSFDDSTTLDNIVGHTKELVEDLTSWFDLKLQYTILDYKEQIERKAKGLGFDATVFVVLFVAVLFALVAAALGLGEWLSHPAWGFLVVTGFLILVAALIRAIGKRMTRREELKETRAFKVQDTKPRLPGRKIPEKTVERNGED